ncbi:MAG TPA: hypothetical protein VIF02_01495, partial [Methylocella sp.]
VRGETDEAIIDIAHRFGYRISDSSPRRNEWLFADISRMTGNWTLRLARVGILARLSRRAMREAGNVA